MFHSNFNGDFATLPDLRPLSNIGQTNGLASLDATGKVPTVQLPASGGGTDPWTYVVLAADFPTTSSAGVPVTGMSFAPSANLRYEIEGLFMLRTATANTGPRPIFAWPTGMSDGVGIIDMTSAAGSRVLQNGNINGSVIAPVGGLPNTTQSWPARIHATMIAGTNPVGSFLIALATETNGTTVTMKAGSWFRWRTF